ncbi:hypothetical protein B7494_g1882 [Chlorociboria aeruginascens]|nr:hypothetical protein B7494_g1882 [Chlorociboria aeruginascens]
MDDGGCTPREPLDQPREADGQQLLVDAPESSQPSSTLPRAFEGMLKTTTETGNIGLFSIRPSRVPQAVNSSRRIVGAYKDHGQKTQQNFQPYGVPSIDDRRRLPSYARDASSEIISMYETASQKSPGRVFDDPDCRSYSMTQTSSYSTYTLSNHRSYASLKSQPEGNLQRPRSPFAYPTRLKRPGFRPSSPALTDGGGIDYSRRAEIDRVPYGTGRNTSSPASLYAQKRLPPPLSFRQEANRSTPSLLSQSSPQRRSPSPRMRQNDLTSGNNDCPRKTGLASVNTSPARSTLSLASTVNLYPVAPALSTTTTPSKLHTPSPLYYDYTEDFDIDDYTCPETLEPPPQFHIDRTIPEDRPLSADWPPINTVDVRGQKATLNNGIRISSSAASIVQSRQSSNSSDIQEVKKLESPPKDAKSPRIDAVHHGSSENHTGDIPDKRVIRLSGLGHGAQELNMHVEEAFGLSSFPSFEIDIPIAKSIETEMEMDGDSKGKCQPKSEGGMSERTGSAPNELISSTQQVGLIAISDKGLGLGETMTLESTSIIQDGNKTLQSPLSNNTPNRPSVTPTCQDLMGKLQETSNKIGPDRVRSSDLYSIDPGLKDQANFITTYREADEQESPDNQERKFVRKNPMISPTIPNRSILRSASSGHSITLPVSSFHKTIDELNTQGHRTRRVGPSTSHGDSDIPNFSHQIPRKVTSRSDSPMLAPKPISPARQLKLKNSIPQLMKSLPPLPPDTSVQALSLPDQLCLSEAQLPCRFSPLLLDVRSIPVQELPEVPGSTSLMVSKAEAQNIPHTIELDRTPIEDIPMGQIADGNKSPTPPMPKLKLKMRNSVTTRPNSPLDNRPWNLDESYPWSNQNPNVRLPSILIDEHSGGQVQPKFKLKITRASNSTLGTVRVNRELEDQSILNLRHPKDLFTPPALDTIFRQVSRHLHSRRLNTSSIEPLRENASLDTGIAISSQIASPRPSSMDLDDSQPPSVDQISPVDARSFFSDDSSHVHGGHSLRKRLSDFRARMAPYASRNGTYSCDDVTWADGDGADAPIHVAARSIPDLHDAIVDTEPIPRRRFAERVHTLRLTSKVRNWFKNARSAIAARMKSRSTVVYYTVMTAIFLVGCDLNWARVLAPGILINLYNVFNAF